jgi:hypothetical protein
MPFMKRSTYEGTLIERNLKHIALAARGGTRRIEVPLENVLQVSLENRNTGIF